MYHLCYLCVVIVIFSRLLIAALWSPAGKGLIYWLIFQYFFAGVMYLMLQMDL